MLHVMSHINIDLQIMASPNNTDSTSPYYTPPTSPSYSPPVATATTALEENQEGVDIPNVQNGIFYLIQRLSQLGISPELRFSDLEYDENFRKFLENLNCIVFELQRNSTILTDFIDSYAYLGDDMMGMPKEILEQVHTCQMILGSYAPKLNRIRGNSEKIFMILIQLVLEGVQVPQMEDFTPLPVAITNIVRAVQDNNAIHPVGIVAENFVRILIWSLSQQFAEIRYFQRILDSASNLIVRIGASICTLTYHHFEFHKDAWNKISEFKREFAACGIRKNLERISRYLDTAVTNSKHDILAAVKQSLCQVWESVKSYKQNYPHKSYREILNEWSKLPAHRGLVLPIVTKMQCSNQEAWEIVTQLFCSLRNPALLEL